MLMGHDMFRVTNRQPAFQVGQYRVLARMTTPAQGFRLGFWTRYNFGPERRWFVQPEASYSRNQSWHFISNSAPSPNNTPGPPQDFANLASVQDWQRLNLAVPVGYRLNHRLLVLGGLVGSRRIPTDFERQEHAYPLRIVGSISHSMRRMGLAWQAGAGMDLGRVMLTARYERSLLNVASDIELDGREYGFRHFATQFSMGMALRLTPVQQPKAQRRRQ
jgi:hypothetical protein